MARATDKALRATDNTNDNASDTSNEAQANNETKPVRNARGAGRPKGASHSLKTRLSKKDERMTVLHYNLEQAIKDYENSKLPKTPKEKLDLRNSIDKIYQEIEEEREKEKIAKQEEENSSEKLAMEFWEQMVAGLQSLQKTIEKRAKE